MSEPSGTKLQGFENKQGASSGICQGLCLYWLSYCKSKSVQDAIKLLSNEDAHFAYIVQGVYGAAPGRKAEKKAALALGLTYKLHVKSDAALVSFSLAFPASKVSSSKILCTVSTSDHAMAMLYSSGASDFFDPNEGFYEYKSPSLMIEDIGVYIRKDYPEASKLEIMLYE